MKIIWIMLAVVIFSGCFSRDPDITGMEGKSLPQFTILLTDSTTYFNTDTIPPNKPFVVIYFGPHCIYSQAEARDISEEMDRIEDVNFYFVSDEDMPGIKHFTNAFRLRDFKNVKIGLDYNNCFSEYYKASVVPFTLIFNKQGKMSAAFKGKIGVEEILKYAKS